MTDHWRAYAEFLPEKIHTKSKAETYTVEGYNSILRYFLVRLRRNKKCYTKSIEMLKYSVLLLMKFRNKELAMFSQQCLIYLVCEVGVGFMNDF
jgi:insertion element IS1 protein InsB